MMTTAQRLRKQRAAWIGGLMCLAGILALAAQQAPVTAQVERVIDGDTLVVRHAGERYTIRLIGADTPETVDPTRPVEYFGAEASAFTRARLDGLTVLLVPARTGDTRDAYGRLLRHVYLGGGENLRIRPAPGAGACGAADESNRALSATPIPAKVRMPSEWLRS